MNRVRSGMFRPIAFSKANWARIACSTSFCNIPQIVVAACQITEKIDAWRSNMCWCTDFNELYDLASVVENFRCDFNDCSRHSSWICEFNFAEGC